jgi:hypothetical protein
VPRFVIHEGRGTPRQNQPYCEIPQPPAAKPSSTCIAAMPVTSRTICAACCVAALRFLRHGTE